MLFKASSILALSAAALAHMEITAPCPRYSSKCTTQPALPPGEVIDYNLKNPIGSGGVILAPMCHHTTPWPQVTETWAAGQPVTVNFDTNGGITHSGGHCEFSVSYDGGNNYVVLHQELQYCFYTGPISAGGTDTVRSYTFTLPANLPGTDHAVFAWTWVNAVGNREFYNTCGDVAIVGAAGSYTGKQMTIANYGPGYPAIPEFLGDYTTGLSYYTTNTTQVTITGKGYSSGGSSSSTTSSAASTTSSSTSTTPSTTSTAPSSTSTVAPTTSTATPTSTAPKPTSSAPASTSTTTGGSGSCTDNTYQCSSDKSGYQVCLGGAWSAVQACSSGTVCYSSSGSVYCGWPQ